MSAEQAAFAQGALELQRLRDDYGTLLDHERRVIDQLARAFLADLSAESVTSALHELRSDVLRMLKEHEARKDDLRHRIDTIVAQLTKADARLQEYEAEVDRLDARRVEEERRVEQHLLGNPTYLRQSAERERLTAFIPRLERMQNRLKALSRKDGPRYRNDRWYRYLTERQWGERGYTGGLVARWFDQWIARLLDYHRFKRNYELLSSGPQEIAQRIGRARSQLAELEDACNAVEGSVEGDTLREVLKHLEQAESRRRDAAEARERARLAYESDTGELRLLEQAQGQYHEEAVGLHREAIAVKGLQELTKLAEATPSPDDDPLVEELRDVRVKAAWRETELAEKNREQEKLRVKIDELTEVARHARERYGHHRSRFGPGLGLAALMDDMMAGRLEGDMVVDRLEALHRTAPRWEDIGEAAHPALRRVESDFDLWAENTHEYTYTEEVIDPDGTVRRRTVRSNKDAP